MSIDEAEISRRNILRLVRKSASTDCDYESLQGADDYPEHRRMFLERRKQFEEPPPPVDKKPPFLPHWINPEYDTDLSITYKKKGSQITDLRINYVDNNDGNNIEIGTKNESNVSDTKKGRRAMGNLNSWDSVVNEKLTPNVNLNFRRNGKEANSIDMTAADKNWLGISYGSAKRPMDKQSKSTKSIRRTQSLKIVEERSSSISQFDTPRKNQSIMTNYSMPRKLIVCKPIVRRPIELKKYDHIVTNVIGTKK